MLSVVWLQVVSMTEDDENKSHTCCFCGTGVASAEISSFEWLDSSGCKPTHRKFNFRFACCGNCYPYAPFVLFLQGLVFGHALSNLIRNVSGTWSSRTKQYDGNGELVREADEHHQANHKVTNNRVFYLPGFARNSWYEEAGRQNVAQSTGLNELEIESSHIKTETPPDEGQEMLEDVLALDSRDYSSAEAQTEVDGAADSEIRAALTSTSSVCNQQEGRLLQRTLRRKTKLTSSAPDRKQSLTKTQKEKRRHKSHRLTSSPSVKLKVSVDSTGTSAVSLGSKEQAWNPFREALKPNIHKVKKSKSSRKKRLTTQCSICYKLLAKFMLGRHMDTKHPGQAHLGDGFFHCKDCGEKFKLLSDLQAHSSAEHQVLKNFKCKICGMSFAKIRNLSLHTRLTHKLAYMKECDICGEGFQKWEELPKHRFKVHGVSDHPCHICGKSFVHEQALNAHLDAHAGLKKYFCEVCGKGFVRFTNLCTHKLTHTSKTGSKLEQSGDGSDNPHTANSRKKGEQRKCAMCIRAVVTKSTVCHLHGGQSSARSYVCSVCGKRFMSSSHLSAHSKQHLEPRFSCDLCAKRFTYKCNLKSHCLSHLPLASKKIFHCQRCSKTFNTHNNLALHERTHEEPTYSCYVCAKGFTRSSNLYRHIRNMHPEHAC